MNWKSDPPNGWIAIYRLVMMGCVLATLWVQTHALVPVPVALLPFLGG